MLPLTPLLPRWLALAPRSGNVLYGLVNECIFSTSYALTAAEAPSAQAKQDSLEPDKAAVPPRGLADQREQLYFTTAGLGFF